uniref:Uncharacterized protein n=1 Tax=Rhizophora mucronata TaxID=61149 RepID=A0A2P2QKD1_RHIMU
MLESLNWAQ